MNAIADAPSAGQVRQRACAAFERAFGHAAQSVAGAPGRVNLIGEHTDYNDGFVLPVAINRYCVAVGAPGGDPARSRLLAADLDEQVQVAFEPVPEPAAVRALGRPWANYVAGVMALFQRRAGRLAGRAERPVRSLDIAVASSVPMGAGLSSSAALEMAVARLLEEASGERLEAMERVRLCQAAEHEYAGVPCGIMDQFISEHGRQGHAILLDCRSLAAEHVPMPPQHGAGAGGRAVVVIADTNVKHDLASGQYTARRAVCEAAARAMGLASLREATASLVAACTGKLSDEQHRCARHVVAENERTLRAVGALRAAHGAGRAARTWEDALVEFGRILADSHRSLRDDYRVSCDELDTLVEIASAADGVYGARMTGGGFGGCAVALVRPEAAARLAEALRVGYRARHGRDCTVYQTGAVDAHPDWGE